MLTEGDRLAIWLFDHGARQVLGLRPSATENRWCVLGVMKGDQPGIGIWVEVEAVDERKSGDNEIANTWTVTPKTCLIRWDFIIHIQKLSVLDTKEIGFIKTSGPK